MLVAVEILAGLGEQAERKAARAGPPVVAPPNAKLVPPASEGCSGTPSCDAASDAHTGPLLIGPRRVGVGGNVGVARDDLIRIEEARGGVVAAVREAVAEDDH